MTSQLENSTAYESHTFASRRFARQSLTVVLHARDKARHTPLATTINHPAHLIFLAADMYVLTRPTLESAILFRPVKVPK
jgi:hypothetical protein